MGKTKNKLTQNKQKITGEEVNSLPGSFLRRFRRRSRRHRHKRNSRGRSCSWSDRKTRFQNTTFSRGVREEDMVGGEWTDGCYKEMIFRRGDNAVLFYR